MVVQTTNAEAASVVTVRVSPRAGGNYAETPATVTANQRHESLVLSWLANVPVIPGYIGRPGQSRPSISVARRRSPTSDHFAQDYAPRTQDPFRPAICCG